MLLTMPPVTLQTVINQLSTLMMSEKLIKMLMQVITLMILESQMRLSLRVSQIKRLEIWIL